MRRLILAALGVLALAGPAAARTAVVMSQNVAGSNTSAISEPERCLLGWLNQFGATYDVLPWSAVDTTAYRTFYVRDTLTRTGVQYDAFAVVFSASFTTSAVYDPQKAWRVAGWASGPMLVLGQNALSGPNKWSDNGGNGDTTGTVATAGGSPTGGVAVWRRYDVATGRGWFNQGAMHYSKNSTLPTFPGTCWRPLIGMGTAPIQATGYGASVPAAMQNADTPNVPSFNPDTVCAWERCPPNGHKFPNAHIVFVDAGITPNTGFDSFAVLAGLARIDSLSGGKVFDNAQRIPQRGGIVFGTGFSLNDYRQSSFSKSGIFCRPDSCDSANVRTTAQDFAALGERGTMLFQPDSAAALAWQKPYLELFGGSKIHFAPQIWRGTSGGLASGIASRQLPVDVFGESGIRLRRILPVNASTLPASCADADSDLFCLMKTVYAKSDSIYPGRVDHTIFPPRWAWALSITRTNGRTLDSLAWSFWWGGARAVAFFPEIATTPSGAGPWSNLLINEATIPVFTNGGSGSTRQPLGSISLVGMRARAQSSSTFYRDSGHDMASEYSWGRVVQPWYIGGVGPFPQNQHNFMTPIHLFYAHLNGLGGAGQGTVPYRTDWWSIRQLIIETQMVNRFAGRTLWQWDWAENVATANPGGLR
jgi:hypothetical protein